MTTKYVVYKRLSKQKTDGNQYGFDSQDFDIQNFLKHDGGEVISEFSEFFSGKSLWTQRKELVKAVELCEKTGATLLVSKVDRMGRQTESVAHLLNRIKVRIATMPTATDMVIQIMAVMAEEEVRAISSRTKAALAMAKSKGKLIGGAAVKKQCSNRKVYETQTQTKYEHLRQPLEALRSAGKTLQQVADQFNQFGYRTSNNAEFKAATVQRVCNYLGVI